MIPKGLFSQIALIIISIGIIFTYIKPAFSSISETQNKIAGYQTEHGKVLEVNNELDRQLATVESVSTTDYRRLLTYMPDTVDFISVLRDLKFISEEAGVVLMDVAGGEAVIEDKKSAASYFAETGNPNESEIQDDASHAYLFTLSVQGSYQQIKDLLNIMELNDYPLQVNSLSITTVDGGFLEANFEIVTYSFLESDPLIN